MNDQDSHSAESSDSLLRSSQISANSAEANSPAEFELRRLQRLSALAAQLRGGRDVVKAMRTALRAALESLGAAEGCVATLESGGESVAPNFVLPPDGGWDMNFLTAFLRGEEVFIPADIALGRLRRRQRMWGVLALRGPKAAFDWSAREALSDIAGIVSEALARIDDEKIHEVRGRIDCKILEQQLRPKDLFYQILHGLKSLTRYDHSATLLICRGGLLEVVAETVTWKKGKSERIGEKLPLPEALLTLLRPGAVYGFDRPGEVWEEWTTTGATGLAELLDTDAVGEARSAAPPDRSLLCAPLATRDRVLGLLRIAARQPGSFAAYEAGLIRQFIPHASIVVQNAQRTESLELNLIQAERKHAMANLAHGVAHDVNNALGAVLPLVQHLCAEVAAGQVDSVALADDLSVIEGAIQTSRRIFEGMLGFARSTGRDTSGADVLQAIATALSILKEGIRQRGIEVAVEADGPFPLLAGSQSDLEQLLLNLLINSRDAMSNGGRLSITVRKFAEGLELLVEDTGVGILEEHLPQVFEPFFTTKPDGNGLGLAICRSIVWKLHGKLEISSVSSAGTRVNIFLPLPPDAA